MCLTVICSVSGAYRFCHDPATGWRSTEYMNGANTFGSDNAGRKWIEEHHSDTTIIRMTK